ncbi:MAG TPA: pantoate--beta-alanine ligase [Bacteroidales bacterium]|nr:pantoate--beta-alanine ligase [Bacteroidales bacterium]HQB21261.1 pantoate--beta-alanine ligase [Bacteroidales bacterium]
MQIITSVTKIIEARKQIAQNLKIGFVPTMGALHQGHISLVNRSVKENDITIVSVFVNPRQFNDKTDLENYPRNIENDAILLEKAKCNIIFTPNNDDLYADYQGYKTDLKGIDKIYEGEFRPGHFQGVVDVVYRLFDLVKPHKAYFGEKDFQQLAIIKLMTKNAKLPIEIVGCEIVRENSGLAMSSRNERLSEEERKNASQIYKTMLKHTSNLKPEQKTDEIIKKIKEEIDNIAFLQTEYAVFCDPENLKPIYKFSANTDVRLCLAVWCKKIRLIDNISLHI